MSADHANAFIEKMKSDEAFRADVMAVADVSARLRFISAQGFDCTAEEIDSLQELRESELNGVVGGDRYGSRCTHVETIVLDVEATDSIENVK